MTVAPQDPDSGGAPSDPPASPETDSNGNPRTLVGQTQQLPKTQQLPPAQAFSSLPPRTSSITGANLEPSGVSGPAGMSGTAPTVRVATPEWPGGAGVPSWGTPPGESAAIGSLGDSLPPVAPTYPTQPGWSAQGSGQPHYPAPTWGPQPYQPGMPTGYRSPAWGYGMGFAPVLTVAAGPQPGLEWGGVGARFWALIADVFVFIGVFMVWAIGTAALGIPTSEVDGVSPPGTMWFVWFLMILVLLYHPVCWYFWGGSPGQKALGLRVARSSNGERLGVGAVLIRYLVFSVVTLLLPLGIISAIVTANDPFKRAWHDTIARSVVVRRI
jgi:uncharacterized RDD family membrane protein YckC